MFDKKINYRKLIEQEPKFKEYISEILIEMFLTEKDSDTFMSSAWAFYNANMTPEQVLTFVRNMKSSQQ